MAEGRVAILCVPGNQGDNKGHRSQRVCDFVNGVVSICTASLSSCRWQGKVLVLAV